MSKKTHHMKPSEFIKKYYRESELKLSEEQKEYFQKGFLQGLEYAKQEMDAYIRRNDKPAN